MAGTLKCYKVEIFEFTAKNKPFGINYTLAHPLAR